MALRTSRITEADEKVDRYQGWLRDARENQQHYLDQWERYWLAYQAAIDPNLTPPKWRSRLRVPHCYQQVETIVPRLVKDDLGAEFQPVERSDDDKAKTAQMLVQHQIDRDEVARKQIGLVRRCAITGTSWAKISWAKQERTLHLRNPVTFEREPYVQVLKDQPTLIPIRNEDVLHDPGASTVDDCKFIIHQSWTSVDELAAKKKLRNREGKPVYKNLSDLDELSRYARDQRRASENESPTERQYRERGRFPMYEIWTPESRCVMVGRTLIREDDEFPLWHGQMPFVAFTMQRDLDKIPGVSCLFPIVDIQEAMHSIHNAIMDGIVLTMDPVFWQVDGAVLDEDFVFGPGERIRVTNPSALGQLQMAANGVMPAFQMLGDLERLMERATGINASISGNADQSGAGTATEYAIANREANARVAQALMELDLGWKRVFEQFHLLNIQFMDEPQVLRIVGADGDWKEVEVRPEHIQTALADVRIKPSTEQTNSELEKQSSIELLNTLMPLMGVPTADGSQIDIWPALRKVLAAHKVNPDEFKKPAPAPDPAMQPGSMGAPVPPPPGLPPMEALQPPPPEGMNGAQAVPA